MKHVKTGEKGKKKAQGEEKRYKRMETRVDKRVGETRESEKRVERERKKGRVDMVSTGRRKRMEKRKKVRKGTETMEKQEGNLGEQGEKGGRKQGKRKEQWKHIDIKGDNRDQEGTNGNNEKTMIKRWTQG